MTRAVKMELPKELSKLELSKTEVRQLMTDVANKIKTMPNHCMGGAVNGKNELCPLKHSYGDGCYIRQITMPKGVLLVSKIHKTKHPYFILKGDVSVLTEQGVVRLTAPYSGITEAGTQRVLYMHEETVWTTVHSTNKTDPVEIEKDIIAKSFDELDNIHHAIGDVK